jgi:hypothetical protein
LDKQNVFGAVLFVCLGVAGTLVALILADYFVWSRAEDEIHLLPQGYDGAVVIVFNRADGQPKEYEGKKRVYRIPTNGILKTQFAEKSGTLKWRNAEYFYVKKDGSRAPLAYDPLNKLPPDGGRIEVQRHSVGTGEARKKDGTNIFLRYAVSKNQNASDAQKKLLEIDIGNI